MAALGTINRSWLKSRNISDTMGSALQKYKDEWKLNKLGFRCTDEEKESFLQGSFLKNKKCFFAFRLIMFAYAVAMTIWFQVYLKIHKPDQLNISYLYFTNWGDLSSTAYFFFAFLLSLFGGVMEYDNRFVSILRGFTWGFSTLSASAQLLLTPIYWTFAPCNIMDNCYGYLNIHRHGIILLMIIIDRFFASDPVRLLHFVYSITMASVYVIVSAIGHTAGGVPSVYPAQNWEEDAGRTVALMLCGAWLGPILAQHVWFGVWIGCMTLEKAIRKRSSSHRLSLDMSAIA